MLVLWYVCNALDYICMACEPFAAPFFYTSWHSVSWYGQCLSSFTRFLVVYTCKEKQRLMVLTTCGDWPNISNDIISQMFFISLYKCLSLKCFLYFHGQLKLRQTYSYTLFMLLVLGQKIGSSHQSSTDGS